VNSGGEMLKMSAPLEHLNLHVREGSILPTQVGTHPSLPGGCPQRVCPHQHLSSQIPFLVLATLQHPCL